MKVAIITDIHDNIHNLVLALKEIEARNIEKIIVLGDMINGGIAKILSSQKIPVFAIWGNNDGEKVEIMRKSMQEGSSLTMASTVFAFIDIEDRKVFLTHYPDLADPMARSGDFDAVFYGHDHVKNKRIINDTLIANPGQLAGSKREESTFMVYDSSSNDVEFVDIKGAISLKTDVVTEYVSNMKFPFVKNN